MELAIWVLAIWAAAVVFVLLLNAKFTNRWRNIEEEDHKW